MDQSCTGLYARPGVVYSSHYYILSAKCEIHYFINLILHMRKVKHVQHDTSIKLESRVKFTSVSFILINKKLF